MLPADKVLITDESGIILDIVDNSEAGGNIESFEGILSPGFINAHCHLELSHLKGVIPENTGLVNFVELVMQKRFSAGNEIESIAVSKGEAMKDAEQEMYDNGIVAVGDICNTVDSLEVKKSSYLAWQNFIEITGFVDALAENKIKDAIKLKEEFKNKLPNFPTGISPHAPYSVSRSLFKFVNEFSSGEIISVHNQECAAENELYLKQQGAFLQLYQNFRIDISGFRATGQTSLQSWMPYFTNAQSLLLVHNTFISGEDIIFAKKYKSNNSDVFFCLCPCANKYIENKMPPADLLKQHDCKIVIGTDSYASNRQLNILEEIKLLHKEFGSEISMAEMLKWATMNGATALRKQKDLGSFEKGKKPGIVLISHLDNNQLSAKSTSKRIL